MGIKILKQQEESVGDLTGAKDDYFIITLEFTTVWKVQVEDKKEKLKKKEEINI